MVIARQAMPRRESVDDTLNRLRRYIQRYERRYEVPSEVMSEAVTRSLVKETAEISRWLNSYAILKKLEERPGRTTGIRTKIT